MKKLLSLGLICITFQLISQEYKYHTFPVFEDKPIWVLREMDANLIYTYSLICIYIQKDTIIEDEIYNKVVFNQYEGEKYDTTKLILSGILGYYRVDENREKVFFKENLFEDEYLIYDFTIQEGDIVYIGKNNSRCEVEDIDTFTIEHPFFKGGQRKIYRTSCESWIEGYGSTQELFPNFPSFANIGPGEFWLNDTLVGPKYFIDTSIIPNPDIFYSNTHVLINKIELNNIKIYPNPVKKILKIYCSTQCINKLQIIDLLGNNNSTYY